MWRDILHLHPVDIIVSADHMIESVLPMHCHKWHSIIIIKQESAISIYVFLHFRCISVLDDVYLLFLSRGNLCTRADSLLKV